MDPFIVPGHYSSMTGIPLDEPTRNYQNRYVRETADQLHYSALHRNGDIEQIPAYSPLWNLGAPTAPIGVTALRVTNPFLARALDGIHQGQQGTLQRQADRRGKGKGKAKARAPVPIYSGTDTECTICFNEFVCGERAYRVIWNHMAGYNRHR